MDIKKLIAFLENLEHRRIFKKIKKDFPYSINSIIKLERNFHEYPIKDILSLIKNQQKFSSKINNAENLILTNKGGQQASSSALANYHAEKFIKFAKIADLCCGNGIDLIQLSNKKEFVFAVDLSPEVLEIAKYNCLVSNRKNVTFQNLKAENFSEDVEAIFVDPDRRPNDKRKIDPNKISPNLGEILKLRKITENLAIKLSPAMDYEEIDLPFEHTFEFISEAGVLKEILLCCGEMSTPGVRRKAVLLPENIEIINSNKNIPVKPISRYIFEPDNAIIRAGLVQECGTEIGYNLVDKKLALLSGNDLIKSSLGNLYGTNEIFAYDLRKLKKYCKENEIGELIIKTRGFPITVEEFRRKNNFALKGKNKLILFIIRINSDHLMILAEKIY